MPTMPMSDTLTLHAARDPLLTAIICGKRSITYRDLDMQSTRLARHYRAAGVKAGDLVAVLLPNEIPFFIAVFAAWKAGATPLPLSAQLPAPERAAILALAAPALVIARSPADACGWPTLGEVARGAEAPGSSEPGEAAARDLAPTADQPWKAIGSGGSTGRPKLILAGRPAVVDPEQEQYGVRPGDVVLVPGPLYHQGPFIFATGALFVGNLVVVMERFDAAQALSLIDRHRVTWAYFVPTMLQRIWRLGPAARGAHSLECLRLVVSTGAPWPRWLKDEWIAWLGPERIHEMYGGTEEQGGLQITGAESLRHPGAIGKAGDNTRILAADGSDAAEGEVGELVFRTRPTGSHLYVGGEIEDRGGWRSYGDLARVVDGYVYLADRRTDLVVSGGVNVYPAEVEGALESHPAVRSVAVIGLPDDDLGQRVHAVVDIGDTGSPSGAPPTPAELSSFLRTILARPKIPRTYEFVTEPLRDDAGKVRRGALRDARL